MSYNDGQYIKLHGRVALEVAEATTSRTMGTTNDGTYTEIHTITPLLLTTTLGGYAWILPGNAGTNPGIHFCGTSDSSDFHIRGNGFAGGPDGAGGVHINRDATNVSGLYTDINFNYTGKGPNNVFIASASDSDNTYIDIAGAALSSVATNVNLLTGANTGDVRVNIAGGNNSPGNLWVRIASNDDSSNTHLVEIGKYYGVTGGGQTIEIGTQLGTVGIPDTQTILIGDTGNLNVAQYINIGCNITTGGGIAGGSNIAIGTGVATDNATVDIGTTTAQTAGSVNIYGGALLGESHVATMNNNTVGVKFFVRTSSPEGATIGDTGDICYVDDGVDGELYLKVTGVGTNTKWQKIGGASSVNKYYVQMPLVVGLNTVTHNLNLTTPKAVVVSIYDDATGAEVSSAIINHGTNSFDISAGAALALVNVTVVA